MNRNCVVSVVAFILCLAPLSFAGEFGEWGPPVNLGPAVNSGFADEGAGLSKDGLSLYFNSTRPGFGFEDIWVSQRASKDDPWGPPVNLGPMINTLSGDLVPNLSRDGHQLFFTRGVPGGNFDLYVSRREQTHDDFAWEAPSPISELNVSRVDAGSAYFENDGGRPQLYFASDRPGGAGGTDIWMSEQQEDGTWGTPVNVAELNQAVNDARPTIRHDGLEIIFNSTRSGNQDLWVSVRMSVNDRWSAPENLGPVVNSPVHAEFRAGLSADGTTLIFGSNRPGGVGSTDLWMTTRSKRGKEIKPTATVPAAPSTLIATGISSSEILLTWSDNSIDESGFKIERCDVDKLDGCAEYVEIAQVGTDVTTYNDTGLGDCAVRRYRVRAFNGDTNSEYSNESDASTFDIPPAAPSDLTATAVSPSQIDLAWADNSTDEMNFMVQRCEGAGCMNFSYVTTYAPGTAYSDKGLSSSTTYRYRVQARTDCTNGEDSAYSNEAEATTESAQPTPPAAPSNLGASSSSSNAIHIGWTDNSNNETGFKIERCDVDQLGGCSQYAQIAQVGIDVSSYLDSGLTDCVTKRYRVRAFNAYGTSDYSNEAEATTIDVTPADPSALNTTAVSSSQINLAWSDNSTDEEAFAVQRCQGAGCANFAQVKTVGANVTTYSDTGLAPNTTYRYRVQALTDCDSGSDSGYSNSSEATTFDAPPPPPAAPSDLTAAPGKQGAAVWVTLIWADNSNDETGFKIERRNAGGAFVQIAAVDAGVTTYSDTTVSRRTTYDYRVRATNQYGDSTYSNVASATTK